MGDGQGEGSVLYVTEGGGGMERKRIGKERMDRKGMGRGWEEGEFKRSWMGRWIGNGKRKR